MKKTPLIPLFAALLLTACDPGFTMEFAIDNQTSHAVTIQSLQPLDTVGRPNHRLTPLSAPAHTDTVVWVTSGLGGAQIDIILTFFHDAAGQGGCSGVSGTCINRRSRRIA